MSLPGVMCMTFIIAGSQPVFAQSDAARLQGIITNQTWALVPGAKVKITARCPGVKIVGEVFDTDPALPSFFSGRVRAIRRN